MATSYVRYSLHVTTHSYGYYAYQYMKGVKLESCSCYHEYLYTFICIYILHIVVHTSTYSHTFTYT